MLFNSLTFLIFLAIVLSLYYRLGRRGQNIMLIVASYVFYGWWDYRFLALLIFTTLFDFACALQMDGETRPGRRKRWLAASITANMTVLGIFKYYDFFASSLQSALAPLGIHPSFPMLHVILPLGISFYTFLSMSYTIDVYRGHLQPTRNILHFFAFISIFPHLVAGPINRAVDLLLEAGRIDDPPSFGDGKVAFHVDFSSEFINFNVSKMRCIGKKHVRETDFEFLAGVDVILSNGHYELVHYDPVGFWKKAP